MREKIPCYCPVETDIQVSHLAPIDTQVGRPFIAAVQVRVPAPQVVSTDTIMGAVSLLLGNGETPNPTILPLIPLQWEWELPIIAKCRQKSWLSTWPMLTVFGKGLVSYWGMKFPTPSLAFFDTTTAGVLGS